MFLGPWACSTATPAAASAPAAPDTARLIDAAPCDPPKGKKGAWLRLTVRDSGPGFDEKNMDKMKDPFFSTKDGGSGLGLAIVTSIVESHGGTVELRNHSEGGAVVALTLPAVAGPAEGAEAPQDLGG